MYLDLHDVKAFYDKYSAGDAQGSFGGQQAFDPVPARPIEGLTLREHDLLDGVASQSIVESDYILYVHGWRMREEEKDAFAETAFKRLYWSGYQGRFGMLSWPTGWFFNPSFVYNPVLNLLGNERNYGNSEAVARQTGIVLRDEIPQIKAANNGADIHLFAHSMGNVVASEMLRASVSVSSYAASQAAESAGSYDANQDVVRHVLRGPSLNPACDEAIEEPLRGANGQVVGTQLVATPEIAWRCYNLNNFRSSSYDMPPDQYRYAVSNPHGPTNDESYLGQESLLTPYYTTLNTPRIVNFFNEKDAALTAWEFNQLTKPDFLPENRPPYEYDNEAVRFMRNHPGSIPSELLDQFLLYSGDDAQVTDRYYVGDRPADGEGGNLTWTYGVNVYTEDNAEILAHIIPARIEPLGQVEVDAHGIINRAIEDANGDKYTDSNQDHSGQFFNSFAVEQVYWRQLLIQSVDLADDRYSGLRER